MSAIPAVLVNEKTTELYGWTAKTLRAPVTEDTYGVPFPKGTMQYFVEAYGYRMGGIGGHNKLFHMINMIKLDLPFFQFESRGYINSGALRVLKGLCENSDVAIAGSASSGKTFPVGAWVLEDWKSAPHATLAFVCTTDLAASEDRIWGAIIKMHQNCKYPTGTHVPHKHVITFGNFSDSASDRDFNAAIKAIAIARGKEGKKAIDTLRGRKQLNVTLVFDELPEMETYVTQGAINLESNTPDEGLNAFGLRVVGIGNPANQVDAHGNMCRPDNALGFKSVNRTMPQWTTRTGICIFMNGEWSPNFEAPPGEPIPFPRLINRLALAGILKRCYGNINSLEYWRNAIGFWPDSSVIQTVLTQDLIMKHEAHLVAKWREIRRVRICGFDTGFTSGGDKCVAQFGEVGQVENGSRVVGWLEECVYMPEQGMEFEDGIAKQVVDDCIRLGVKPENFGMDISGDGGKMMRAIIRYWLTKNKNAAELFPISSMGLPTERIVSNVDPRKCKEVFDRRVTEYWMMVREAVMCEIVKNIPLVNEKTNEEHPIIKQLCARIYSIANKKFSIETKDEMKERTAGESPDNADAFVYMIEMARRLGIIFMTPNDKKRESMKVQERKEMGKRTYDYASDGWGEDEVEAAA